MLGTADVTLGGRQRQEAVKWLLDRELHLLSNDMRYALKYAPGSKFVLCTCLVSCNIDWMQLLYRPMMPAPIQRMMSSGFPPRYQQIDEVQSVSATSRPWRISFTQCNVRIAWRACEMSLG
jgi:hypothetical protein